MINAKLNNCCGCGACAYVCPVGAIKLNEDAEGFLYPEIDSGVCISCNKCDSVCPFSNERLNGKKPLSVFGFKHSSDDIRLESSSGGFFTALSDEILNSGGAVYGSVYNENFDVVHNRAVCKAERDKMRGSKYVQSDISNIFPLIKKDLDDGRNVLFVGTPCQVSGVKRAFSGCSDLITCDVICHGVPSPELWRAFRRHFEKKQACKLKEIYIRDTHNTAEGHITRAVTEDGKEYKTKDYVNLFFTNNPLRPSCYNCPFTTLNRDSDFTMGDFWGIEKNHSSMKDEKGVSFCFANTGAATEILKKINDEGVFFEASSDDSLQPQLYHPCKKPLVRKAFWKDYYKKDIDFLIEKYVVKKYGIRLKLFISKILNIILHR